MKSFMIMFKPAEETLVTGLKVVEVFSHREPVEVVRSLYLDEKKVGELAVKYGEGKFLLLELAGSVWEELQGAGSQPVL